jgi:hypothetical protein
MGDRRQNIIPLFVLPQGTREALSRATIRL